MRDWIFVIEFYGSYLFTCMNTSSIRADTLMRTIRLHCDIAFPIVLDSCRKNEDTWQPVSVDAESTIVCRIANTAGYCRYTEFRPAVVLIRTTGSFKCSHFFSHAHHHRIGETLPMRFVMSFKCLEISQ